MGDQNYIIMDYGASHGRCIVARYNGETFTMETVHDFDNIPLKFAGTLYWDLLRLINEMKTGIRKAHELCRDIKAIGIDTWGCDFAFIDRNGKLAANPVNYRDDARHTYKKKLDALMGEYEIFRLGGANTNSIMSLYHLYAQKQMNASEMEIAGRFLMMPDLFNYYLTGIPVNEYTNATMALIVNQENKKWEEKFFDALGFPRRAFGELIMPGTLIGPVQKSVAAELEIPQIPVIGVATHDTASAIAGMPIRGDQKWLYLSLGTWAILGIEGERVYKDPKTFSLGLGNQGGCEGKTNLNSLFTGLWVIQQCYERWCGEAGRRIGWDAVAASLNGAGRGKAFIDLDAEDFVQPSPNMPARIQEYCMRHGQQPPQSMGDVAMCVYESLVMKVKSFYNAIREVTGEAYEVVHFVGGGSQNKVLCQWVSDALGIPVKAGPTETTSVGNLLLQLKGAGEISTLAEGRAIAAGSVQITDYMPRETQYWNQYYGDYVKAMGQH